MSRLVQRDAHGSLLAYVDSLAVETDVETCGYLGHVEANFVGSACSIIVIAVERGCDIVGLVCQIINHIASHAIDYSDVIGLSHSAIWCHANCGDAIKVIWCHRNHHVGIFSSYHVFGILNLHTDGSCPLGRNGYIAFRHSERINTIGFTNSHIVVASILHYIFKRIPLRYSASITQGNSLALHHQWAIF